MANIRERKKNGKIFSYQFTAYLGRDEQGQQIRRYMTWVPPDGLSPTKSAKAAQRAADDWERELTASEELLPRPPQVQPNDFVSFVTDCWLALFICNGDRKETTVAFYTDIAKSITAYFKGAVLQEITPLQIQHYLQHLRMEHERKNGQPISARYLRHHYGALKNIFGFAERNELISKNPMNRVAAPKIPKKPVDALSPEQASVFFEKLAACPLDFRTLLHLLITTGLRRGEALGLQWRDVDEKNRTLHVQRAVAYTARTGIVVNTPKTASSIRVVPLLASTLSLLQQLKAQAAADHSEVQLDEAYIFPSSKSLFEPRDPNAVTKRTRNFMARNGLPVLSPHDLRHSCATLLLAESNDIKSVQMLLGHSDASVTLNYYVRANLQQLQAATDKFAKTFKL